MSPRHSGQKKARRRGGLRKPQAIDQSIGPERVRRRTTRPRKPAAINHATDGSGFGERVIAWAAALSDTPPAMMARNGAANFITPPVSPACKIQAACECSTSGRLREIARKDVRGANHHLRA